MHHGEDMCLSHGAAPRARWEIAMIALLLMAFVDGESP